MWMFNPDIEEQVGEDVAKIVNWRGGARPLLDLLKVILSVKTKQAAAQPVVQRSTPLRKDLEDQCFKP